jgi:hypothetical protein
MMSSLIDHDRDRRRCLLGNFRRQITKGGENIDLDANQLCGELRELLQASSRIAKFD